MSDNNDDAVGFRRPPEGRRFQKGVSGNPKGRPRKAQSLSREVERALSERVEIKEHGKRHKVTKRVAAAKQLANSSASGDFRAIKLAAAMTAEAEPAGDTKAPLTAGEEEVVERLIARIRQGWRLDDELA